jgi:hypothetical protein
MAKQWKCQPRRMTSLLLAVCVVAFFCLSGVCFVTQIHHRCTGEHCPVCERLALLLALAIEFGLAGVTLVASRAWVSQAAAPACTTCEPRLATTPTGRFDRMNS